MSKREVQNIELRVSTDTAKAINDLKRLNRVKEDVEKSSSSSAVKQMAINKSKIKMLSRSEADSNISDINKVAKAQVRAQELVSRSSKKLSESDWRSKYSKISPSNSMFNSKNYGTRFLSQSERVKINIAETKAMKIASISNGVNFNSPIRREDTMFSQNRAGIVRANIAATKAMKIASISNGVNNNIAIREADTMFKENRSGIVRANIAKTKAMKIPSVANGVNTNISIREEETMFKENRSDIIRANIAKTRAMKIASVANGVNSNISIREEDTMFKENRADIIKANIAKTRAMKIASISDGVNNNISIREADTMFREDRSDIIRANIAETKAMKIASISNGVNRNISIREEDTMFREDRSSIIRANIAKTKAMKIASISDGVNRNTAIREEDTMFREDRSGIIKANIAKTRAMKIASISDGVNRNTPIRREDTMFREDRSGIIRANIAATRSMNIPSASNGINGNIPIRMEDTMFKESQANRVRRNIAATRAMNIPSASVRSGTHNIPVREADSMFSPSKNAESQRAQWKHEMALVRGRERIRKYEQKRILAEKRISENKDKKTSITKKSNLRRNVGMGLLALGVARLVTRSIGGAFGAVGSLGDQAGDYQINAMRVGGYTAGLNDERKKGFEVASQRYRDLTGMNIYKSRSAVAEAGGIFESSGVDLTSGGMLRAVNASQALAIQKGTSPDEAIITLLNVIKGNLNPSRAGLPGLERSSDMSKTLENIEDMLMKNSATSAMMIPGLINANMQSIRSAPGGLMGSLMERFGMAYQGYTKGASNYAGAFFGSGSRGDEVSDAWASTTRHLKDFGVALFGSEQNAESISIKLATAASLLLASAELTVDGITRYYNMNKSLAEKTGNFISDTYSKLSGRVGSPEEIQEKLLMDQREYKKTYGVEAPQMGGIVLDPMNPHALQKTHIILVTTQEEQDWVNQSLFDTSGLY